MSRPNPWKPARNAWLLGLSVALMQWGWQELPSPWRWVTGVIAAGGYAGLLVLAAIGAEYLAAHPVPKPRIDLERRDER